MSDKNLSEAMLAAIHPDNPMGSLTLVMLADWVDAVRALEAERDSLRAEVERLKGEVDAAESQCTRGHGLDEGKP
jgi:hypothetical protein